MSSSSSSFVTPKYENPTNNEVVVELCIDDVMYERDQDGWIRPYLGLDDDHEEENNNNGRSILGPVVGRSSDVVAGGTTRSLDLDPIGYAGEYVVELLRATPVVMVTDETAATTTTSTTSTTCSNKDRSSQLWLSSLSSQSSSPPPYDRLRRELNTTGVAFWNNAVDNQVIQSWRNDILSCTEDFEENGQDTAIRSDIVRFDTSHPALQVLEHVVARVTQQQPQDSPSSSTTTSKTCACRYQKYSLWRPEQGMVSQYLGERQAHYAWHTDNQLDHNERWTNYRVLTAILYLNPSDWDLERDGGGLQCQSFLSSSAAATTTTDDDDSKKKKKQTTTVTTICPTGGTIVLMDSRTVPHTVLPAHRDRLAITQWFVAPGLAQDPQAPIGMRLRQKQQQQHKRPCAATNDNFCRFYKKSATDSTTSTLSSPNVADNAAASKHFSFGFF